ncbi:MAG TPA: hypothetical protein VNO30_03080 [Kofleriaceae bacterium]|nr:hypothetical protein [Kofleriaceae bacterium]
MFLGHFAVGLAARPLAPRVPLPVLLLAPLVMDVAWPVLVAVGVERARIEPGHLAASPLVLEHMPYSHSLVAGLGWALATALIYGALARDRRGAIVVAALVLSHWLLDWITHEPDMPLVPGGGRYGLGLWRSLPGTLVTELVMFAAGAWLYTRATRATGPWGRYGWPALGGVLALGFVGGTFGKPPEAIEPLLVTMGLTMALVIGVAIAVDRQRPPRPPDPA